MLTVALSENYQIQLDQFVAKMETVTVPVVLLHRQHSQHREVDGGPSHSGTVALFEGSAAG